MNSNQSDLQISDRTLFFRQFLAQPRSVGAVLPSSQYLVRAMCDNYAKPVDRIVELGPGTGVFTQFMLEQFPEFDRYWAFEINASFKNHLQNKFPEIELFDKSAELVTQCLGGDVGTVDFVISGLPFANIPSVMNERILDATYEIMRDGALFSTFVYFHTFHLPRLRRMRYFLAKRFLSVEVIPVWHNFPPAFVIRCVK